MSASRIGSALAALGLVAIVVATLTPQSGTMPPLPTWCIVCGELGGVDVVLNVLLFIPFAAGLAAAGVRPRRIVACCFALSLSVELLQIRVVPGRDASLGDLLMNTLGGLVGAALGATWRAWLIPTPRRARRLQAGAAAAWLAILALSAWALRPSPPLDVPTYGQPLPRYDEFVPYDGALLSLTLNGMRIENAPFTWDPGERAPMRRGDSRIEAVVTAPRQAPSRLSAIGRLANGAVEAFLLAQRDRDLVVRMRLRAADLRLRTPSLALARGLGGDARPGDTLRVAGGLARGGRYLFAECTPVRAGAPTSRTVVALSPALGWALLLPFSWSLGPHAPWLSALWILALALPMGYWGALGAAGDRGTARARTLATAAVSLAAGIGAIPLVAGMLGGASSEWAAGAAGLAAGWLVGSLVARRAGPASAPVERPGVPEAPDRERGVAHL